MTSRQRAYGYFYTERFLAEVAGSNGAEALTAALAGWTTRLWQLETLAGADKKVPFYIDGHRKPVYTDTLIPRGLVGRLSTILGYQSWLQQKARGKLGGRKAPSGAGKTDSETIERAMYELNNCKDQVMTVFKVALVNLVMDA